MNPHKCRADIGFAISTGGNTMKTVKPFSNGSEAMNWLGNNCDECWKSKFYNRGDKPADYRCRLNYWISLGMVSGEIPLYVAKRIGTDGESLNQKCKNFSAVKPERKKKISKATKIKLELWERENDNNNRY